MILMMNLFVVLKGIYEKLAYWSGHHNRELQHLGMLALEGFLRQVREYHLNICKIMSCLSENLALFIQTLTVCLCLSLSFSWPFSLSLSILY